MMVIICLLLEMMMVLKISCLRLLKMKNLKVSLTGIIMEADLQQATSETHKTPRIPLKVKIQIPQMRILRATMVVVVD